MSNILAAMAASLGSWAASGDPRGTVAVAADAFDAYALLKTPPPSWMVVLWWEGDGAENERSAASRLRAGVAVARGLPSMLNRELTHGRAGLPPVLDLIEGVCAHLRGMHEGAAPAAAAPSSCWLLRYTGGEWIRFEADSNHYVHQLNFSFARQLPAKMPLAVTLA